MICYTKGKVDQRLVRRFNTLESNDNAETLQLLVRDVLESLGFSVMLEYPVDYMGKHGLVHGRVDLLAQRGFEVLAIEVDRSSPRKKSIAKLEQMASQSTGQVILLRSEPPKLARER